MFVTRAEMHHLQPTSLKLHFFEETLNLYSVKNTRTNKRDVIDWRIEEKKIFLVHLKQVKQALKVWETFYVPKTTKLGLNFVRSSQNWVPQADALPTTHKHVYLNCIINARALFRGCFNQSRKEKSCQTNLTNKSVKIFKYPSENPFPSWGKWYIN